MKILLFCFMAMADIEVDTGESTDTAVSAEDTAADTGEDTADMQALPAEETGQDTTDPKKIQLVNDTFSEYTTAADLAGETGGLAALLWDLEAWLCFGSLL